jgi:hypothetical protein
MHNVANYLTQCRHAVAKARKRYQRHERKSIANGYHSPELIRSAIRISALIVDCLWEKTTIRKVKHKPRKYQPNNKPLLPAHSQSRSQHILDIAV